MSSFRAAAVEETSHPSRMVAGGNWSCSHNRMRIPKRAVHHNVWKAPQRSAVIDMAGNPEPWIIFPTPHSVVRKVTNDGGVDWAYTGRRKRRSIGFALSQGIVSSYTR